MKIKFRLKDIINNYMHTVVLPDRDMEGNVVPKNRAWEKIRKGEFEFVFLD